jgi:hypothetical protein
LIGGRQTLIGISASALTTAGAARSEAKPIRKPRRGRMRLLTLLSFSFTRIGEHDLLLPIQATSSSPPLPVKAGWRGRKPSLDAVRYLATSGGTGNVYASELLLFYNQIDGRPLSATPWVRPIIASRARLHHRRRPSLCARRWLSTPYRTLGSLTGRILTWPDPLSST